LVKRYGSGAEQVAYATAVNQVKKKAANKPEEPMEDVKLKEMVKAALSKPLDEATPVKEGKHNAKDFIPYMTKDLNNPNFLKVFIQYPTQTGFSTALGQRTMTGQDLEYNVEKAMKIGQVVADKLDSKFNLEDLDVYDNGDGKVIVFAVSDDFIEMNTPPTGLDEDMDLGHQDNEPHMIKAELAHIGKYAMELYKMIDQFEGEQEVDFPGWWQAKITTARNMISSAKHYLEFELEEPKNDAMVDVASEEGAIGEEMTPEESRKKGMPFKDVTLDEKLKPSMGIQAYIKDFIKSDDPKFKGESKKERIKRAAAAFYQAKK
jgi:hypothetical protein